MDITNTIDMKRTILHLLHGMASFVLATVLLTSCDNTDWDDYIGKPYDATLTIQPEYELRSLGEYPGWYRPCICGTDENGNICTYSAKAIEGFDFEEGYIYTIHIHAQPNRKEAVWGDAPPYNYSMLKLYDKIYVGIDETGAHEETLQLTDSLVDIGHDFPFDGYLAINTKTGTSIKLCRGEVIGFESSYDRTRRHRYTMRVKVYPQQQPTTPLTQNRDKYRLVELLETTELP